MNTTLTDFQNATGYTPDSLVAKACLISEDAAKILTHYHHLILSSRSNDVGIETKSDNSPVTKADKESSDLIETKLSEITPDIPIVSEENDIEPNSDDPYWAIDPLDGTKIFINGGNGFAINIALMLNGQPALGIVACPAHNRIYYTATGMHSYKKEGNKTTSLDSRRHKPVDSSFYLRTVFDAAHADKSIYDKQKSLLQEKFGLLLPTEPSSERWIQQNMMLIEGLADVHIKTGRDPNLLESSGRVWDNAADHILLRHSGGGMVNLNTFHPLEYTYGRDKMPAFAAFADKKVRTTFFPNLS